MKKVYLKQVLNLPDFGKSCFKCVCIGDKILVLIMHIYDLGTKIYSYDVYNEKWSFCDSIFAAEYSAISCVKYPMQ